MSRFFSRRMPARLLRLLVVLLTSTLFANSLAYAAGPPMDAAVAKQKISLRGVGKQVKLVRKDGTEIKGRIMTIGDDSVGVEPKGATVAVSVAFDDVTAVKGTGLSTGAKVGIGVGIGLVVAVGVAAIVINHELNKPWNF